MFIVNNTINGDFMFYLNVFFIFSILGHFLEGFFYTYRDSGILYGYWTPIYGYGVIIILYIYDRISKKTKLNKLTKLVVSFLIGFILLTILEYIGGILIKKLLKVTFWDYSSEKFNIGKYTSLKMALIWGLSSVIIIYFIKPILEKVVKYIPNIVTYILTTLFAVDSLITLLPYLTK